MFDHDIKIVELKNCENFWVTQDDNFDMLIISTSIVLYKTCMHKFKMDMCVFYLIVYQKNRLHIEHLSGVGKYQKGSRQWFFSSN